MHKAFTAKDLVFKIQSKFDAENPIIAPRESTSKFKHVFLGLGFSVSSRNISIKEMGTSSKFCQELVLSKILEDELYGTLFKLFKVF